MSRWVVWCRLRPVLFDGGPMFTCIYVLLYEGKCKWSYGPSCPVDFPLNIFIHSFIHRNTPTGGGGGVLTIYAEQVSVQPTSAVNTWHAAGPCCRDAAAVDRYLLQAGRSAENPPHAAAAADSWGTETDNSTLPEHQLLY